MKRAIQVILAILFVVVFWYMIGASWLQGAEYDYLIVVDYKEAILALKDVERNKKQVYPIGLPRITPKALPAQAWVRKIEKDPYWRPTAGTREYYFRKEGIELPELLSPGDPRNAMGKAKIILEFETPGMNSLIRIHGINDPSSISQRISRGCIRLHNEDILELVEIIAHARTRVILR